MPILVKFLASLNNYLDITILLTMVVFMDQLSQNTPPMSSNLPVIGKFFVASMVIISISMISTILCLNLHHSHRKDGKPMSRWVRRILKFFRFLE